MRLKTQKQFQHLQNNFVEYVRGTEIIFSLFIEFMTILWESVVNQATRSKISENDENQRLNLKPLKTTEHRSENVEAV